jgi:hypothetical protein
LGRWRWKSATRTEYLTACWEADTEDGGWVSLRHLWTIHILVHFRSIFFRELLPRGVPWKSQLGISPKDMKAQWGGNWCVCWGLECGE